IAARRAVSARAYPEAVRHYALATELAKWLPEAGPDLLEEAAQAASWARDAERAPRTAPRPGPRTRSPSPLPPGRPPGRGCWSGSGGTGGRAETPGPRST